MKLNAIHYLTFGSYSPVYPPGYSFQREVYPVFKECAVVVITGDLFEIVVVKNDLKQASVVAPFNILCGGEELFHTVYYGLGYLYSSYVQYFFKEVQSLKAFDIRR